jgi:hypothetical protein
MSLRVSPPRPVALLLCMSYSTAGHREEGENLPGAILDNPDNLKLPVIFNQLTREVSLFTKPRVE